MLNPALMSILFRSSYSSPRPQSNSPVLFAEVIPLIPSSLTDLALPNLSLSKSSCSGSRLPSPRSSSST